MTRQVRGLRWARLREAGPFGRSRPRGAKAMGVRYERQLAKQLGAGWRHGQWIEFEDANGRGWAQPDFILIGQRRLVVLEAKYTWVPEAMAQLDLLYRPLCEALWGLPVVGFVVCKNLIPQIQGNLWTDLGEMLEIGRNLDCLHWIGTGPLWHDLGKKDLTLHRFAAPMSVAV